MGRRSPEVISYVMRRVRSCDTAPELALRRELWKRGFRYRLRSKQLPGHPDIVFPSRKVAVFVDGDFWHGNQWRVRHLQSLEEQFDGSPSASYWIPKIHKTVIRDANANQALEELGWTVVRFWESDMKRDLARCVDTVVAAVEGKTPNG